MEMIIGWMIVNVEPQLVTFNTIMGMNDFLKEMGAKWLQKITMLDMDIIAFKMYGL